MVKNVIVLLLALLFMSGTASAANVYLKDGGIITCIFARQEGATVYVLVNRYTEVELDRGDVALKKTFKGKITIGTLRSHKKKAHHNR